MASAGTSILSESLNTSCMSNYEWQYQLEDLPNELLILILGYLPLPDLAKTRLVCSRLQKLVDDNGCRHLWARATLEGDCLWLTNENKTLIHRAAEHGNVEALIMLAVAHLYSEGVPEGSGKGTYKATNGIRATEHLIRAEQLTPHTPPFSWVLFRPPWASNNMCCKACVCQRMKDHCANVDTDSTGLHYCIGKVLGFHDDAAEVADATQWFGQGSQAGCIHSRLETWRRTHKKQLLTESLEPLRELRATVSQASFPSSLLSAQLELCSAYARGFYGGHSRTEAMGFMREVFGQAKAVLWERVYQLQENMSHNVRYILIDWIIEVAGMKSFSPQTVHLAVSIIDRYLLQRTIPRSKLQLLGITALLLAARWSSEFILTVREASWLTEETYQYEDVVRMMGGLVATFKGEVKKEMITDYLDVVLDLVQADPSTRNMTYYLSECLLLHARFGRYSASHLAAACLLEARILLGVEFPWPQRVVDATGLTVCDLKRCCLAIYDECLTDKNLILDYRKVKLESVTARYANDTFGGISKHKPMSYTELKEQLGMHPDASLQLFTPTPKPRRHSSKRDKLLSFLSDSCYLNQLSPTLDSDSSRSNSNCSDISDDQLSYPSEDQSPNQVHFSASELDAISSPCSSSYCSFAANPIGSGFPQPIFDNDEFALSSPPNQSSKRLNVSVFKPLACADKNEASEHMDTEDTLFSQSQGADDTPLDMRALTTGLVRPTSMRALTAGLVSPTPTSMRALTTGLVSPTPTSMQGSEETLMNSPNGCHPVTSKQFCLDSKTFKSHSFEEPEKPNARVALQPVDNNVPSPSFGGKVNRKTHSERNVAYRTYSFRN